MAAARHLTNAPIVEALVDFRVELPGNTDPETALQAKPMLEGLFPRTQPRFRGQFSFSVGPEAKTHTDSGARQIGYDFCSADGTRLVQLTVEGFTLNWLKPYTRWEDLRDMARLAWGHYVDIFKPEVVTRVGLRYINNLSIPLPLADFGEYLVAAPKIPDELPQGLASFLTSVFLIDEGRNASAAITQATQGDADNKLSVLLDIDVSRSTSFAVGEDEMWPALEDFRNLKNEAFFGYVTDKLLDQYV